LTLPLEARNRRLLVLFALGAGVVLLLGFLLRPKETPEEPAPHPPSQTEISRLHRLTLRGSLDSTTEYFTTVASDVEPSVLYLPESGSSAIVWDAALIVAPRVPWRFPRTQEVSTAVGEMAPARTTVSSPDLPVAAMSVSNPEVAAAVTRAPETPAKGGWLFALWRNEQAHVVSPAHFLETVEADCREFRGYEVLSSLTPSERMAGAGVFDLDGRLLGIVLRCGERWATLSVDTVAMLLVQGASFQSRLLERCGMRLSTLGETERAHFGVTRGVLVTETWLGYAADVAGLRPGDVILEVDGQPVEVPGVFRTLLEDGSGSGELQFTRGRRARTVSLALGVAEPSAQPSPGPALGLGWGAPLPGQPVESVLAGSLADQAGIREGDRLVRLDQVPVSSPREVRRVLSRRNGKPVYLELARGHKRWGVLLRSQ